MAVENQVNGLEIQIGLQLELTVNINEVMRKRDGCCYPCMTIIKLTNVLTYETRRDTSMLFSSCDMKHSHSKLFVSP